MCVLLGATFVFFVSSASGVHLGNDDAVQAAQGGGVDTDAILLAAPGAIASPVLLADNTRSERRVDAEAVKASPETRRKTGRTKAALNAHHGVNGAAEDAKAAGQQKLGKHRRAAGQHRRQWDAEDVGRKAEAELEDEENWSNPLDSLKDAASGIGNLAKSATSGIGNGLKALNPFDNVERFTKADSVDANRCKVFYYKWKCNEKENGRVGWIGMGDLPPEHPHARHCGHNKNEQCIWCCPPYQGTRTPANGSPHDQQQDDNDSDETTTSTTLAPDNVGWKLPSLGGWPSFEMPNMPGMPNFDPSKALKNLPGMPNPLAGVQNPFSSGSGSGQPEQAKQAANEAELAEKASCAEATKLQKTYEDCQKGQNDKNFWGGVKSFFGGGSNCKTSQRAWEEQKDKCEMDRKKTQRAKQSLEDAQDEQANAKAGAEPGCGGSQSQEAQKETQDLILEAQKKLQDERKKNEDTSDDDAHAVTLNGKPVPSSRKGSAQGCNRCWQANSRDYPSCPSYTQKGYKCFGDQCALCDTGQPSTVIGVPDQCAKQGPAGSEPDVKTGTCRIVTDAPEDIAASAAKMSEDAVRNGMKQEDADKLQHTILDQASEGCHKKGAGGAGCSDSLDSDVKQAEKVLTLQNPACFKKGMQVEIDNEKHFIKAVDAVNDRTITLSTGLLHPHSKGQKVIEVKDDHDADTNDGGMSPNQKEVFKKAKDACTKSGLSDAACEEIAKKAADGIPKGKGCGGRH